MAAASASATDSVVDVPDTISVSFLPKNSELSQKVLEKGLNYFTQSYVHDIRVSKVEKHVQVYAKCWRSMRKSEPAYPLRVEIDTENSTLSESYCECKAGYVFIFLPI